MSSEQFERKLRERLSGANIPPSPELWGRIEAGMAEDKRNRRGGFWWLFSDGLGIILLLFIFLFPLAPSTTQFAELKQTSAEANMPPIAKTAKFPKDSSAANDLVIAKNQTREDRSETKETVRK